MIFVTLGTQDKEFKRLLEAIESAYERKEIKDRVVVQAGYTKFNSKFMELFDYIPKDEFEKCMDNCDLLITHGGVGSIMTALNAGKKVIAAARLQKYGEHTNDHQIQIIEKFAKEDYIINLDNFDEIGKKIKMAKKYKFKKFKSKNKELVNYLESYIDNI